MVKETTILVVEDEKLLMKAITAKLQIFNFNVIQASTVDDAWLLIQKTSEIKAVWLDHYLMGGKSGFDMLVLLREDDRYRKLPVFIVSNSDGADKIYAYTKLHINKYYVKAQNKLYDIVSDIKSFLVGEPALEKETK